MIIGSSPNIQSLTSGSHKISRGAHKLAQIPTVIQKKKGKEEKYILRGSLVSLRFWGLFNGY